MDDLISRQAAVEAVSKGCEEWRGIYARCEANLLSLPPAEPEIIRCKDCKWCENADGSMCKNPASWVVATDRDFGCVLAERRTDGRD